MKRKILIGLALVVLPFAAWATCTSVLVMIDGKAVPCTTCCTEGGCFTRCY